MSTEQTYRKGSQFQRNTRPKILTEVDEIKTALRVYRNAQILVKKQIDNDSLWEVPESDLEEDLQSELMRLHDVIQGQVTRQVVTSRTTKKRAGAREPSKGRRKTAVFDTEVVCIAEGPHGILVVLLEDYEEGRSWYPNDIKISVPKSGILSTSEVQRPGDHGFLQLTDKCKKILGEDDRKHDRR